MAFKLILLDIVGSALDPGQRGGALRADKADGTSRLTAQKHILGILVQTAQIGTVDSDR